MKKETESVIKLTLHQCSREEMICVGKNDPVKGKSRCGCRQKVTKEQADVLLAEGRAKRIVTKRWYEQVDLICSLCNGDPEFKKCANCLDKRTITTSVKREEYGNAIVAVSMESVDKTRRYRTHVAMKTPRVATIEAKHIFRAFLDNNSPVARAAQQRIEEYGLLTLQERAKLVVGFEPEDNPKTGQGRRYDYGRSI